MKRSIRFTAVLFLAVAFSGALMLFGYVTKALIIPVPEKVIPVIADKQDSEVPDRLQ